MWPHAHLAQEVTIVAAVLTFVLSIMEMYVRGARYLNAVVAVFLFLSALTLPALRLAPRSGTTPSWRSRSWSSSLVDRGPQGVRREREVFGRI